MGKQEYYVMVTERDLRVGFEGKNGGWVVWETYLKNASLSRIKQRVRTISDGQYGKVRIAKLIFIEE